MISKGAAARPTRWPPDREIWITTLDPTCVPPADSETILLGAPDRQTRIERQAFIKRAWQEMAFTVSIVTRHMAEGFPSPTTS